MSALADVAAAIADRTRARMLEELLGRAAAAGRRARRARRRRAVDGQRPSRAARGGRARDGRRRSAAAARRGSPARTSPRRLRRCGASPATTRARSACARSTAARRCARPARATTTSPAAPASRSPTIWSPAARLTRRQFTVPDGAAGYYREAFGVDIGSLPGRRPLVRRLHRLDRAPAARRGRARRRAARLDVVAWLARAAAGRAGAERHGSWAGHGAGRRCRGAGERRLVRPTRLDGASAASSEPRGRASRGDATRTGQLQPHAAAHAACRFNRIARTRAAHRHAGVEPPRQRARARRHPRGDAAAVERGALMHATRTRHGARRGVSTLSTARSVREHGPVRDRAARDRPGRRRGSPAARTRCCARRSSSDATSNAGGPRNTIRRERGSITNARTPSRRPSAATNATRPPATATREYSWPAREFADPRRAGGRPQQDVVAVADRDGRGDVALGRDGQARDRVRVEAAERDLAALDVGAEVEDRQRALGRRRDARGRRRRRRASGRRRAAPPPRGSGRPARAA